MVFFNIVHRLITSINSTELDFHGEKIDVSVDDLDDTHVIGNGNFGIVYEVTLRRGERTIRMALKVRCFEIIIKKNKVGSLN